MLLFKIFLYLLLKFYLTFSFRSTITYSGVYIFAILDCCRVDYPSKFKANKDEIQEKPVYNPDRGQLILL